MRDRVAHLIQHSVDTRPYGEVKVLSALRILHVRENELDRQLKI